MTTRTIRRPAALRFISWAYIFIGVAVVIAAGLGPTDEETSVLPLWVPLIYFVLGVFLMAAGAAMVNERRWSRALSVNVAIAMLVMLAASFVIQAVVGNPNAAFPLIVTPLPLLFVFYLTRRYVREYFARA